MTESLLSPVDQRTPRLIGDRYQAETHVSSGPATERWLGTDRLLNRPIALTLLADEFRGDRDCVARFHGQARQWSKITDRRIVRVYDIVREPSADAVIVEQCEGTDLGVSLIGVPLAAAAVLDTALAITEALSALHGAGLLHLGLHPGAVLLRADGRVLLTEIGMARLADHHDRAEVTCVAPEVLLGTPVGPATDLYSLGALLYQCIAGTAPFQGSTRNSIAMARLHRDPPPLGKRRPGVPSELVEIVESCLARNPSARPQSAGELHDRLVSAKQVNDAATIAPRRSRRRWVAAGAAAAMLVAGTTIASAVPRRGENAETVPVSNPVTAAPGAPFIVALGEFDPSPGDGRENPRQLGALTDGNPQTVWTTERYSDRAFGRKDGVGLVFELSSSAPLGSLTVTSPSRGWSAEVFVADRIGSRLVDWGVSISARAAIPGNVELDLGGRSGRYVLLWITDLGDTRRGPTWYQLQISGVALTA